MKLPPTLVNSPYGELLNYLGYFARREKTMLSQKVLTRGSKNCFIPYGDKVIPRLGSTTYGQIFTDTENAGILGHNKKFKNLGGIEMEVRGFRSEDNDLGDVVQVEYNGEYVSITENPNPNDNGTGRMYFTVFNDRDLDPSQSKNLPRLVWVDGYEDPTTKKGRIFSWTGGIVTIANVTATDLELPTGITWRSLGFSENANGDAFVVVNGTAYQLDDPADLNTNSIDITSTAGISIGDIATSQIEIDEAPIAFDQCKQAKGYVYYGNIKQQRLFQSNAYGKPSTIQIVGSNAVQNDLVISENADFTGLGRSVYTLTVKDTHPEVDSMVQQYSGSGTPIYFDITGYTPTSGRYKYEMKCIANIVITGKSASYTGTFIDGEIIRGVTSGATGIIYQGTGIATNLVAALHTTSGQFEVGEVVIGQSSGATIEVLFLQEATFVTFWRNNAQVTSMSGGLVRGIYQLSLNSQPSSPTFTFVDGLIITFPLTVAMDYGDILTLDVEKSPAAPDEFVWQKNNGSTSSEEDMDTSDVTIEDGIIVKWIDDMGHTIGDYWKLEVNQKVDRAWANFYYTIDTASQQSIRRPAEGYIYNLPSNFWTMDTLEETLMVNTSNGDWGYVKTELSADLLSEKISYESLKQSDSNKVLYPYLTGHNADSLIFINQDKELMSLGRLQLIEKIQTKTLSNDVKLDFDEASFINGSIEFQDNKVWITSPNEFVMFCYDDTNQYWQPPQYIPENALLSVVGNQLISHSSITNTTRKINDPDAVGDDGAKYEVVVRSGAFDYGDRWAKKNSNQTFFEAYIYKLAPMELSVYLDVDEPHRTKTHWIEPVFGSETPITATFGGDVPGGHSFASSGEIMTPYAREIYDKLGVVTFYFASLEFKCNTDVHDYELLSMGLNITTSKSGNKNWSPKNESEILPFNFE